ncbi:MAG: hypothetical protein JW919_03355 [Candidatus Omnitrophica bacterium]|nr:hypothetical protein [Candidatus Omnitrophota bacterium]
MLTIKLVIISFLTYSIFPTEAHAYLDPGTGGFLFQTFIASLIGVAFTVKLFWKKIITGLKGLFSRKKGA